MTVGAAVVVILGILLAVLVGVMLGQASRRASLEWLRVLREVRVAIMTVDERLQAVVTAVTAANTAMAGSISNLQGDIQRLSEAVKAGQPSEATIEQIEALAGKADAISQTLSDLAAVTPEPAPAPTPAPEPVPTPDPVTEPPAVPDTPPADAPPADAPPVDPNA